MSGEKKDETASFQWILFNKKIIKTFYYFFI